MTAKSKEIKKEVKKADAVKESAKKPVKVVEKQNEASAFLSSVKSSPLKVLKITKNLRGYLVEDALKYLQFCNLKLAKPIKDLIYSAMSNAENNHNMDVDNLYIDRFEVGKAFVLKRFSARARGRSSRILKTFSSIRVVLVEKNNN